MLRVSARGDGSAFVRNDKDKRNDSQLLSSDALRKRTGPSSWHGTRRPGTGISEAMANAFQGVASLNSMVTQWDEYGFEKLLQEYNKDQETMSALDTLNFADKEAPEKDKIVEALTTVFDFYEENNELLQETLEKIAVISPRLWLFAIHQKVLMAWLDKRKEFCEAMPDAASKTKEFKKWQAKPKDRTKMIAALSAMMLEAKSDREAYEEGGGNDMTTLLKSKSKKNTSTSFTIEQLI